MGLLDVSFELFREIFRREAVLRARYRTSVNRAGSSFLLPPLGRDLRFCNEGRALTSQRPEILVCSPLLPHPPNSPPRACRTGRNESDDCGASLLRIGSLFGSKALAKQSGGKIASPLVVPRKKPESPTRSLHGLSRVKMGSWPALPRLDSLQRLVPSWFKPQNTANVRFLVYGILLGFSFSLTATSFVLYFREKKQREIVSRFKPRPIELRSDEIVQGVTGLIGALICCLVALHAN